MQPDAVELVVHVNDAGLAAGLALSQRPLSDRGFHARGTQASAGKALLPHPRQAAGLAVACYQASCPARSVPPLARGLRSTVCAAMVQLAGVCAGETVLDPCCGSGSLLREALADGGGGSRALPPGGSWPGLALAMDCDEEALARARQTLSAVSPGLPRDMHRAASSMLRGDFRRLPLRQESVDVMLADIPFGRQHAMPADAPLRGRASASWTDGGPCPSTDASILRDQPLPMMATFLDEAGVGPHGIMIRNISQHALPCVRGGHVRLRSRGGSG